MQFVNQWVGRYMFQRNSIDNGERAKEYGREREKGRGFDHLVIYTAFFFQRSF
jgi:hypothetical protein